MKKIAAHLSLCLLASLALLAPPALGQTTTSRNPSYHIGPRDLIEIKVYEVPELNVERRVSEEGAVNLPLIGDVRVSGMTDQQVAQSLKTLLESKYVQRASVDVSVREFRSRPISVIGAVKQPGNLAFSGRWSLLEALAAAGGLAENHGNTLYVLRRSENGLADQVAIDVDDLLVKADPRVNIPILSNDMINVPATVEVTVYCLGEVEHPGALVFKSTERLSLLATIARAGGLSQRASSKILVKRGAKSPGPKEITVDYKRIIAGKDPDVALGEGDVIVVKESFF